MQFVKVLSILLVGAALATNVGCSSTRTQKSAGEQIDDTIVLGKVKTALIDDPVTKAGKIDVEVFRGVVQLNGFVDSGAEKSRATTVARGVSGVSEVRNNLTVRAGDDTPGEVTDDSALTAKVKLALAESEATKAHQINVETKASVVHLSGFVNNATSRDAATAVAKSVTGVQSVVNQIDVK
jgi:hyperosmotically inducible protein